MAIQTEVAKSHIELVRGRNWEYWTIRGILYLLLFISMWVFLILWFSMPPESERSLSIFIGNKIAASVVMIGSLIGIAASLRRD